jgi:hypothetical protein
MKKYKGYIFLGLIFIVSIVICIYALKWHAVYKEDMLNTTIITDYIHELRKPEFINYISDNPYAIIYFGVTSDDNCRRFEKKFKDYIINNNLGETIVYISVNEIAGEDFGSRLDKLYNKQEFRNQNKYFDEVPALAVYNNTTLVDFISSKDLTVDEVDELLSKYNINGE